MTSPSGKRFVPPTGRYWAINRERFEELDRDQRIWWGPSGDNMPARKRFLTEVQAGIVPQTLWQYSDVGHTQEAKKELLQYVHFENTDNVLDTVKPTRLLRQILRLATSASESDIVLDFFAGSASTAHAVLLQNQEDGGSRKFICVQLPEPLPAAESRLATLADISKERIRNVIASLNAEDGEQPATKAEQDRGVRIFQLAASHLRPWQGLTAPTAQEYAAQLALFNEQIAGDADSVSLIWEVAIREGLPLTAQIKAVEGVATNVVYQIYAPGDDRSFFICLDARLDEATLDVLPLTKTDLFVCRDSALNDTLAANLAQQCELRTL